MPETRVRISGFDRLRRGASRRLACNNLGMTRLAQYAAAVVLLTSGPAIATVRQKHPYFQHWKHSTYGRRAIAGVAASAAITQAEGAPHRWGGGVAGFASRAGAGFATHAVKTTVEHVVAAPLHEDLHYYRSTQPGFGPRLRHALVSTVVTRNTRTGKRTPFAGRIAGNAAAGAIGQVWLAGASGASTAGIGLAVDAGANVAREFLPRRHHRS